jgi:type IV pilus assembly protein PilA
MKEKDQGFTLIELLVVIVIIGILAAIAIPIFLNQRKKGVDAGLKSDLKSAATSIETWNVDNPSTAVTDATGLTVNATTPGSGPLADFSISKGNTLILKAGTDLGSYKMCAYNSGASDATSSTSAMLYDSASGGLQPAAGACP